MKKVIALQDLDCANCAAKMEDGIRKLDGVNSVSISFMTQKMVLDIDENNSEEILKEIRTVCRRIEPDCKLKI